MPVLDYIVNYDYISQVLCENKAKPELHCNGKCHLMKELAKASDENKDKTSDKKQSVKLIGELFFEDVNAFSINTFAIDQINKDTFSYHNLYSYLDTSLVFHPPIS
nr:hypothetical protein [Flavobacterium algicola]